MPNQDYLRIIDEAESIAEEIIYNAKIDQKDRISKAKEEAKEILIKTKLETDAFYKETLISEKMQADQFLKESNAKAQTQAKEFCDQVRINKDRAISNVVEVIINHCSNN